MIYVPYVYGQLGEQLFHHAHLMSCAAHFETRLVSNSFDYVADFPQSGFSRWRATGTTRVLRLLGWKKIIAKGDEQSSAELLRAVETGRNITLHLDSWLPVELQQEHSPETSNLIRRRLTPGGHHVQAALDFIESLRPARVIGVQVRRSEGRREDEGSPWLLPLEATLRAMHQVRRQIPSARFIVCCDEPLHYSDFSGLPVVLGPGSPIGNLMVLAHCDRILMPPHSSVAAWASWWGQVEMQIIEPEWITEPQVASLIREGVAHHLSG